MCASTLNKENVGLHSFGLKGIQSNYIITVFLLPVSPVHEMRQSINVTVTAVYITVCQLLMKHAAYAARMLIRSNWPCHTFEIVRELIYQSLLNVLYLDPVSLPHEIKPPRD
jgi:hypothetical protein